MSYTNIAAQLVTVLDSISAIEAVFNHEPKELANFPAATVSALGHNTTPYDTGANRTVYNFMVRLYYRVSDAQKAEEILRALTDTVITTLKNNLDLNNSCDWNMPISSNWLYQERESGPVRVVEMTVQCTKRETRS